MELKVKKMRDNAILPIRGTVESAGIDLHACIKDVEMFMVYNTNNVGIETKREHPDEETIVIPPRYTVMIPTGIACDFPEGYFGLVLPRSSVGAKRRLTLANTAGVIDHSYNGEIMMVFENDSDVYQTIEPGERLAQMILLPYVTYDIVETDTLTETERGEGGFGSTGV